MIFRNTPLQSMKPRSVLGPLQTLKNGGTLASSKDKMSAMTVALPLTSLIDAFSIIVIYLLIGTQTGGVDTEIPARLNLPVAESGAQVHKETSRVRIENGRYFINDKPVPLNDLAKSLAALNEKEIIIQADKKMFYAGLDPLIKAGSSAGIQKLKFAVSAE